VVCTPPSEQLFYLAIHRFISYLISFDSTRSVPLGLPSHQYAPFGCREATGYDISLSTSAYCTVQAPSLSRTMMSGA
jgi:hypothetical protein